MNIGAYDQKIAFYKEGTKSDGGFGTIPTRDKVLETWASIEQLQRSRALEQAQEKLNLVYRVKIQSRESFTLDEKYIVNWRDKDYKIITGGQTDNVRLDIETVFDICQS